jgi:hypothetical protein
MRRAETAGGVAYGDSGVYIGSRWEYQNGNPGSLMNRTALEEPSEEKS